MAISIGLARGLLLALRARRILGGGGDDANDPIGQTGARQLRFHADFAKLGRDIGLLADDLRTGYQIGIARALPKIAYIVQEAVKQQTPVRRGHLKQSTQAHADVGRVILQQRFYGRFANARTGYVQKAINSVRRDIGLILQREIHAAILAQRGRGAS